MPKSDNINIAFTSAVYKKLNKRIEPLLEKIDHLEEITRTFEATPGPKGSAGGQGVKGDQGKQGPQGPMGLLGPSADNI